MNTTFGAFAGGQAGAGDHGVDSRHVRPTTPRKSRSLSTDTSQARWARLCDGYPCQRQGGNLRLFDDLSDSRVTGIQ